MSYSTVSMKKDPTIGLTGEAAASRAFSFPKRRLEIEVPLAIKLVVSGIGTDSIQTLLDNQRAHNGDALQSYWDNGYSYLALGLC